LSQGSPAGGRDGRVAPGRDEYRKGAADNLLGAAAVRQRCAVVYAAAERGETRHFRLIPDRLEAVAERVAAITRQRYPDLDVPFHSRWRHFSAGGVDRATPVASGADRAEAVRARLDLAVVSVLLDAGAGPHWSYREAETGRVLARSEGLAVAALRAMQAGLFSADPAAPWRADAAPLTALTEEVLGRAFQHRAGNELAGLAGRTALLRRLGQVIAHAPEVFGCPARLGNLYDFWLPRRDRLAAPDMLGTILRALGPVWPGRLSLGGVPLGDCGRHSAVPGDGLVPFHKLSQWLVYSLVEPLVDAGFRIVDLDGLTGLAEYRNGGLFLDAGALEPRDAALCCQTLDPLAEQVVEWRALTVALLDRLAPRVRALLGKDEAGFPLMRVLEGGTWAAGRALAAERRPDGAPPLTIASDGTWF
jgi:hypothetical protein